MPKIKEINLSAKKIKATKDDNNNIEVEFVDRIVFYNDHQIKDRKAWLKIQISQEEDHLQKIQRRIESLKAELELLDELVKENKEV